MRDQYGLAGRELIKENKGALEKIGVMVDKILTDVQRPLHESHLHHHAALKSYSIGHL